MFDVGINFLGMTFLGLCVAAALSDIRTMKIPNSLNLMIFLLAFAIAFILAVSGNISWAVFGWHFLAATIAFVAGVVLFSLRAVGGGDAKYLPGALMWVGPAGWIPFLFFTSLVGGGLAIFALIWRKIAPMSQTFIKMSDKFRSLSDGKNIPAGVAITSGVFVASVYSPIFAELSYFSQFG